MNPGDYVHTFITAADSEREGLILEEATGEPRRGCHSSLAGQAEGGFGDRFWGLAWDKLPAAHCLAF